MLVSQATDNWLHMKLQATILLPLETRKIACGNAVILSPKRLHQSSVLPKPCSTDNHNNKTESILNIIGLCFGKESVFLMYFACVLYVLYYSTHTPP